MAITAREEQIIYLHEAGLSVDKIAAELRLSPSYVRERVKSLCFGLGIDRAHVNAMRLGSRDLLAAIERERAGGKAAC